MYVRAPMDCVHPHFATPDDHMAAQDLAVLALSQSHTTEWSLSIQSLYITNTSGSVEAWASWPLLAITTDCRSRLSRAPMDILKSVVSIPN